MTMHVRHVAAIWLALVGVAVLFAACGAPSTPGVASAGSSSTTSSPPPTSENAQFARFGSCMRSNGEPQFQNPTANGNTIGFTVSPSLGIGTPRYARAVTACERYLPFSAQNLVSPNLPPGMVQRITPADEVDYLKAVDCMHSHGFPSIPDPMFTGGTVHVAVPASIDENSALFRSALATCRKLIPSGLPYSH
ncbi:MAG: hypothetical protein WCF24_01255 [Acidimicrobiales bacterium]